MKTNVWPSAFLAMIIAGTSGMVGCSSFQSSSSEYAGPGGFSQDVSALPDPNAEPPKTNTERAKFNNVAAQYGYGQKAQESPERLLLQADSYFEQKRYYDSSRLYKKYLATSEAATAPAELLAVTHYRLGFVERKKMFFAEAAKEFKQAVALAPQNDEYVFAYAKTSYEAGDYQTADRQFVALLNRNSAYPDAQKYYGMTLLESSNRTNALQPLTVAVGELQAYAMLTDKYYEKGELEQARQAEGQTVQIAARLGRQVPDLPNKVRSAEAQNQSLLASAAPQYNAASYTPASAAYEPTPQVSAVPNVEQQYASQGYVPAPTTGLVAQSAIDVVPSTENSSDAYSSYSPSVSAQPVDNTNFIPTTESAPSNSNDVGNNSNATETNAQSVEAPTLEPQENVSEIVVPTTTQQLEPPTSVQSVVPQQSVPSFGTEGAVQSQESEFASAIPTTEANAFPIQSDLVSEPNNGPLLTTGAPNNEQEEEGFASSAAFAANVPQIENTPEPSQAVEPQLSASVEAPAFAQSAQYAQPNATPAPAAQAPNDQVSVLTPVQAFSELRPSGLQSEFANVPSAPQPQVAPQQQFANNSNLPLAPQPQAVPQQQFVNDPNLPLAPQPQAVPQQQFVNDPNLPLAPQSQAVPQQQFAVNPNLPLTPQPQVASQQQFANVPNLPLAPQPQTAPQQQFADAPNLPSAPLPQVAQQPSIPLQTNSEQQSSDFGAQVYAQITPSGQNAPSVPNGSTSNAQLAFQSTVPYVQPIQAPNAQLPLPSPEASAIVPAQNTNEEEFAFATSGTSSSVPSESLPAAPAIVQARPQVSVQTALAPTASTPPNAPIYVAAAPTDTIRVNTPAASQAPTTKPAPQYKPIPYAQPQQAVPAVPGSLPTDSLFNVH